MAYSNHPPTWYFPANVHADVIASYNPAWSLDNDTWFTFPGALLLQCKFRNRRDVNVKLQSDLGQKFVYNMFSVPTYELAFMVTDNDLVAWEGWSDALNGESTPFCLSLAGDGSDSVYVRKTDNFEPVEIGEKTWDANANAYLALYHLVINLEQEVLPWPIALFP